MHNPMQVDVHEARRRLVGSRDLFSISELFHENSKITQAASRVAQSIESIAVAPHGFKRYRYAIGIALPAQRGDLPAPLWEAITDRRSCRLYAGTEIALQQLSDLVFLTNGTQDGGRRRCLPSAGGLYPLELYVAATRVEGLAPGLYHYDPRAHALMRILTGDYLKAIAEAVFIPEALEGAAAVVILTAMFGRSKIKYGERAYRFALLEAGHAMQNLCLAATALGLGSCPVGGFIDDRLNDLLNIDGVEEATLYAAILGAAGSP
jgi:SagB-type dehydrogenase family enzyme